VLRSVKAALTLIGAKFIKIHGVPTMESGTPDIIGCHRGRCFTMELKRPGEKPTPLQEKRLREWQTAGAITGVVTSAREALELLE